MCMGCKASVYVECKVSVYVGCKASEYVECKVSVYMGCNASEYVECKASVWGCKVSLCVGVSCVFMVCKCAWFVRCQCTC